MLHVTSQSRRNDAIPEDQLQALNVILSDETTADERSRLLPRFVTSHFAPRAARIIDYIRDAHDAGDTPSLSGYETWLGNSGQRLTPNDIRLALGDINAATIEATEPSRLPSLLDGIARAAVRSGSNAAIDAYAKDRESLGDIEALRRLSERLPGIIASADPKARPETLVTNCAADIVETEVEWLWPNRIPLGELVCLYGPGGNGKGLIVYDWIARLTRGMPWPDHAPGCTPGDALIFSAEENTSTTIIPRLQAADADRNRVFIAAGREIVINGRKETVAFDLSRIGELEETIAANPAIRLVVIDPIMSYLADADAKQAQDVRIMLAPLQRIAEERRVTFLYVNHENKGGQQLGSTALRDQPRVCLAVIPDPTEEGNDGAMRWLAIDKHNMGSDRFAIPFRPSPSKTHRSAWHVEWGTDIRQVNAAKVKAEMVAKLDSVRAAESDKPADKAETLIHEMLRDGPCLSAELEAERKRRGIPDRTYDYHRKRLGVRSGRRGEVWWSLLPGQQLPPPDIELNEETPF